MQTAVVTENRKARKRSHRVTNDPFIQTAHGKVRASEVHAQVRAERERGFPPGDVPVN